MSSETPAQGLSSPKEAPSFSPYRRRFRGETRRQMLERRLGQSPRGGGGSSFASRSSAHESSKAPEPPPAPTLTEADLTNGVESSLTLVQRRVKTFGGTADGTTALGELKDAVGESTSPVSKHVGPMTPASDQDDERKSYFSGGTVTTATSSTTQPLGYTALSDDLSSQGRTKRNNNENTASNTHDVSEHIMPQHMNEKSAVNPVQPSPTDLRYYRIVYKGVVSLLSCADPHSSRSGAYLSYGEVVSSRAELEIETDGQDGDATTRTMGKPRSPMDSDAQQQQRTTTMTLPPLSPPRSVTSAHSCSVSSLDTLRTASTAQPQQQENNNMAKDETPTSTRLHVIRVDNVLTGGYAMDGTDAERKKQNPMQTPKRSNAQNIPVLGTSPLQMAEPIVVSSGAEGNEECSAENLHYGYLFTQKKNVIIAEPIEEPPVCQKGNFLYKITSSSPLPILTGPCVDAPKTRAMVLPGTIHEVCLRFIPTGDDDVVFLRLSHRRGWIADRRISKSGGGKSKLRVIPVLKDVTDEAARGGGMSCDGSTTSSLSNASLASSSIDIAGSVARRRHRPPRRKRDKAEGDKAGGRTGTATRRSEPMRTPAISPVSQKLASPSSNISLLSDESSLDHNGYHGIVSGVHLNESPSTRGIVPPKPVSPSLFLMRVNAPRGLKILDAPHFQVSNLIHGQQGTANAPGGYTKTQGLTDSHGQHIAKKPTNSIFQTMGGSHTTPSSRSLGNPAVFDGKVRTLPRGALFEASKRMESTGASFSQGSGLIKLSDNSGWAIIPRQEELDVQYRHYHGGVASIKEGEATRAFEEMGNAIVDVSDEQQFQDRTPSSIWLRLVDRNGVLVSCPPPTASSPVNDDDTSPTSSTGGGSSIVSGGGSNFGVLTSQDSDVASSVGSAFLDAVFRTPKKKELGKDVESRRDIEKSKRSAEQKTLDSTIPCGMCVEVDRWDTNPGFNQDYVRLAGGQGWIPRHLNGTPCAIPVEHPDVRFGSFWFRVLPTRGIRVRRGPSRRAASIKSEDGIYFRFECGEFLRACEVMTIFSASVGTETFAKLYRNRHVQFQRQGHENREHRLLSSLTAQAEWVQVHSKNQLYLEECGSAPHIQRHRQGWRYNSVHDSGIEVRKGPSFAAELSGEVLLGGESVLINERVTGPGERITWLRLKDGEGWVHDVGLNGEIMMIAHSLHDRSPGRLPVSRPVKAKHRPERDEATYNTLIARLFHGDDSEGKHGHAILPKSYKR